MRSLTYSSAGTYPTSPPILPIIRASKGHSHMSHSLTLATHGPVSVLKQPQPAIPSPSQTSFFEVTNDSSFLSSRAKKRITKAIQNGWQIPPLEDIQAPLSFSSASAMTNTYQNTFVSQQMNSYYVPSQLPALENTQAVLYAVISPP